MNNPTVIGKATLYNADCRDVLPAIQGFDVIISDPPYGIGFSYDGEYRDIGGDAYMQLLHIFKSHKSIILQYPEETMRYLVPMLGVPEDCVAWCYNANTQRQFRLWNFFNIKPDFNAYKVPPKNPTDKRVSNLVRSYDWFDDLQQVKNVSEEKTDHPCQIPVKVMERIIALSQADNILDPFMGSGSTAIACINLGKNFIGIEKEEKYFNIACERIFKAQQQERLFA